MTLGQKNFLFFVSRARNIEQGKKCTLKMKIKSCIIFIPSANPIRPENRETGKFANSEFFSFVIAKTRP